MPVTIFFCYAREDRALLNKLKTHLRPLQRQSLIDVWHDGDILAGTEWEPTIQRHLNTAQIILLLVSPDFMDSDYCYGIEMKRALKRHTKGEAKVIPIILRDVFWHGEPLGKLHALPTDGKPVTSSSWHDMDAAFYDITQGIHKVVEQLMAQRAYALPVVAESIPQQVAYTPSPPPFVQQRSNAAPLMPPPSIYSSWQQPLISRQIASNVTPLPSNQPIINSPDYPMQLPFSGEMIQHGYNWYTTHDKAERKATEDAHLIRGWMRFLAMLFYIWPPTSWVIYLLVYLIETRMAGRKNRFLYFHFLQAILAFLLPLMISFLTSLIVGFS